MIDATAIILTKNEEKNIEECLLSMKNFAKRCVVIDSGSTDRTLEIAKNNGADIYFNEFEYYAKQFNWGINNTNIQTEWIIRLDADERFPIELRNEIELIIQNNKQKNIHGITIEADFVFLGKKMSHGLRNKRKMMLFKKKYGRIENRRRDAHSIISDGVSVSTKNKFLHYDFKDLNSYIKKYNWYATREMQDYIEFKRGHRSKINTDKSIQKQRKKKFNYYYKAPKYLRAWLWFIYNYIIRLGLLDGKEGFLYIYLECYWYRVLVDGKIEEYEKNGGKFEKLTAID